VKVSTATFESAQYILFRHIHINFYVSCIHVGIPMMGSARIGRLFDLPCAYHGKDDNVDQLPLLLSSLATALVLTRKPHKSIMNTALRKCL
jgi:hypothetical protein